MMSELSIAQKQYILSQKRHQRSLRIGRVSICILFLIVKQEATLFTKQL